MRIQHNIMALNAHRQLNSNNNAVSKSLEKLSSGYRINRAGDDAAGLAISEKMRAQIKGLEVAQENAQDGISLIQTAEGSLTEVHSMLNRMVELATKAANGTYQDINRGNLQDEIVALSDEIDRIAGSTNFNGLFLLDGSKSGAHTFATVGDNITAGGGITNIDVSGLVATGAVDGSTNSLTVAYDGTSKFTVTLAQDGKDDIIQEITIAGAPDANEELTLNFDQIGLKFTLNSAFADDAAISADNTITTSYDPNKGLSLQIGDTSTQRIGVKIDSMTTAALGIDTLNISSETGATDAIQSIKDAIDKVSKNRSALGALQNRLDHTINNLGVTTENLTAAEARIRDVDMAKEMMDFTKMNVLTQAAQAMLAQANQQPQSVLQLLR